MLHALPKLLEYQWVLSHQRCHITGFSFPMIFVAKLYASTGCITLSAQQHAQTEQDTTMPQDILSMHVLTSATSSYWKTISSPDMYDERACCSIWSSRGRHVGGSTWRHSFGGGRGPGGRPRAEGHPWHGHPWGTRRQWRPPRHPHCCSVHPLHLLYYRDLQ